MSSINPIIKGEIKDGQFEESVVDQFFREVTSLPDDVYEITIKKPIKSRSIAQNAYFHGVVVKLLSDETGTEFDDMKDLLKTKFLNKDIVVNDKVYTIVRHSANLSTVEFEDFARRCREFGDSLNIFIPLPGEVDISQYQ